MLAGCDISERSSSAKLKLNESTKRNAWLSLRDTSPLRVTNSEECDVVWRNRYFCFLARLASLLLQPWCAMIELCDTTRPAEDSSEPSEAEGRSERMEETKYTKCSLSDESIETSSMQLWFIGR